MNFRKSISFCLVIFVCSIVFADADVNSPTQISAMPSLLELTAMNAAEQNFTLGSTDANSTNPYLLQLQFTTKGAAITTAVLKNYDNRDHNHPMPYQLLSSFENINSMATAKLVLPSLGKTFPLDKLNWQSSGRSIDADSNNQSIVFNAVLYKNGEDFIRVVKTYTLKPNSCLVDCDMSIENLSSEDTRAYFETIGAVGVAKEDSRTDVRSIATAYQTPTNSVAMVKTSIKDLTKNAGSKVALMPKEDDNKFLWTSANNKYFTAIIRPVPFDETKLTPQWIASKTAVGFDADGKFNTGDEQLLPILSTAVFSIPAGGSQSCSFQLYLGAKDKKLFEQNELYKSLGFVNVIDFQACCGDTFKPLSFFILAAMNWIYSIIPNYGIVIIIFVFVIRILLHPITKRSQVSMMKMGKLGPKAEEIKQKYANNKAEMNKQMMTLYKEHGASPVLGCLPMLLQMPIWFALYSAINSGIEFRGAPFLPFWITDLSSPDAIFFLPKAVESIPFLGGFLGNSFNLLPIFLGVAMFAQQKLMPSSAAPSSNPQAAQQQKIMLWMMPVMMLLFLYRAPSGLNLYIMSSTTAGVIEQYIIRKHIRQKEQTEAVGLVPTTAKFGGKLKKKKPKPPIKF